MPIYKEGELESMSEAQLRDNLARTKNVLIHFTEVNFDQTMQNFAKDDLAEIYEEFRRRGLSYE